MPDGRELGDLNRVILDGKACASMDKLYVHRTGSSDGTAFGMARRSNGCGFPGAMFAGWPDFSENLERSLPRAAIFS